MSNYVEAGRRPFGGGARDDTARVMPEFLYLFCTLPKTIEMVNAASVGSAAVSRNRFKEEEFLML